MNARAPEGGERTSDGGRFQAHSGLPRVKGGSAAVGEPRVDAGPRAQLNRRTRAVEEPKGPNLLTPGALLEATIVAIAIVVIVAWLT